MYVFACFCYSVAVLVKWALFILYTLYRWKDWYILQVHRCHMVSWACTFHELCLWVVDVLSWAKALNDLTHLMSWYFELIHVHELADFVNLWTGRAIHAQTCHYEKWIVHSKNEKTWKGSRQQFHYHDTFVTHSSETDSHNQQVDVIHTVHKQQTKQIVMKPWGATCGG